ncbi:MAG: hypothetical protein RLZZ97_1875, partial [Gemmatimonadota bacterium]
MSLLRLPLRAALLATGVALSSAPAAAQTVQLRYDASVASGPITGRAFFFIART